MMSKSEEEIDGWSDEWQDEEVVIIEEKVPDFSGPTIEEVFDVNPCLLEIGPISLNKLIYGTMELGDISTLTYTESAQYAAIIAARIEVANNFMTFFNIKPKK